MCDLCTPCDKCGLAVAMRRDNGSTAVCRQCRIDPTRLKNSIERFAMGSRAASTEGREEGAEQ